MEEPDPDARTAVRSTAREKEAPMPAERTTPYRTTAAEAGAPGGTPA